MLDRDTILNANDHEAFQDVEVPEWGGTVRVKIMSGAERDEYDSYVVKQSKFQGGKVQINTKGLRAKLLTMVLVKEDGTKLFTPQDIPALLAKSGIVLDRLSKIADKLNGLSESTAEELLKNSVSAQSEDGGSDSQDN